MPTFTKKDHPRLGFDPMPLLGGRGAFQMVPRGGARGVLLLDGPKHTLEMAPSSVGTPGKADFIEIPVGTPNRREIWINGLEEGGAILAAKNPSTGMYDVKLECQVTLEWKKTVGFYILKDAAGRKSRMFTAAKALAMLNDAYEIIYHQTNVKLESAFNPDESFDVQADLGDTPMVKTTMERVEKLVTFAAADFHVFLIWKMEDDALAIHGMTPLGVTVGAICLIKDTDKDVGTILAHEAGHRFGLPSHNEQDPTNLMYKLAVGGKQLNKQQMLKVNQFCS